MKNPASILGILWPGRGQMATGGNADSLSFPSKCGGGMYVNRGSPTLRDCTFAGNSAHTGGGMYNVLSFKPPVTLVNCTFIGNTSQWGGGMDNYESDVTLINCTFSGNRAMQRGGGMNSDTFPCFLTLTDCTFIGNRAGEDGGGMYNGWESELTLNNCIFTGNSATENGGAMYNYWSWPILTNCCLNGNLSCRGGGGIYNDDTLLWLTNCTFAGNSAANGNAIACDSVIRSSHLELTNCILSDGGNEIWNNDNSTITITYSDMQGGWPGRGNIDADPCFAEPGYWADANDPNVVVEPNAPNAMWIDGDYHLKSRAGRWDAGRQSWVQDNVTSPCIDAGDMASPIGHEPFPNGGIINMGAYGGTEEASKSYFGEPVCETIIAGDINGDCIVNFVDFAIMAFHWLEQK